MKARVSKQKKAEAKERPEWDRSTTASQREVKQHRSVEEKVAAQIASEMLRDNQKLKGVHSGQSLQKIIEAEAKRQLLEETNGGQYNPPIMSKV